MAIDPRRLRPTQLVQLLNSTPLGEVIGERQLYRHRERAGLRIVASGEPSKVDLLRYLGWLVIERHRPRPEPEGPMGYEALKERARQRNIELSIAGRDIGELPAVVNPDRRARAANDFRFFCEQYFPLVFHLAWSDDHLKVIAKIELAVLKGGLFAMAMPRGSGKTSLCETACLWALIYGHREFVALIGADESHATTMLESIKSELENNELLLEDFPEVVYPIHKLEGIHQRAGGQLYQGKLTRIAWTAKEIVLPTMPESSASGAIIGVGGITGCIRGMKHKRADGSSIRPSLVLIDDPQTDESARSPSQCMARERLLAGAILGMAGPGRKIAGLMTLTVVRPDDLADRILDRDKHPQWQGERTKMVYKWPSQEKLWDKYAELWRDGMKADRGIEEATDFYRKNREAMDEGASIAWPQRHHDDELSAIQHAANLKLDRGEAAFYAEYQNEPLPEEQVDEDLLTVEQIMALANGRPRGQVPVEATILTAFIDVQAKALFWMVAAWQEDFTGYVIDYGTEPDQKAPYFALRDIKRTLATAAPRAGLEGSIYAGLERLAAAKLGKEWTKEGGSVARIDRCLIDANWGNSTDVVYQFCRQSNYAGIVMPSHGRYVGAASKPFWEYRKMPGDKVGVNWRIPVASKRALRHVTFDTNFWKSFIHARLAVAIGDSGSLSLFGKPGKSGTREGEQHRLVAEHFTSEYRVKTEGRGRKVDEWKLRVEGRDNHWFDAIVGCAVAASMQGAALPGLHYVKPKRRVITYSQWQQEKRMQRQRMGLRSDF